MSTIARRRVHPHALAAPPDTDDDYRALAERAFDLATALEPHAAEADALSVIHEPTRQLLCESGLLEAVLPKQWGGRHDRVDPVDVTVVREQLMAVSAHADFLFACQGLGSHAITARGTGQMQERYLPGLMDFSQIGALALTEPQTGSDLRSIETRVEQREGDLVLSGAKSFISMAGVATFYSTLAKEGDAFSLVLVDAATPGVSAASGPELSAAHILGSVQFDDVRLDDEARVGRSGDGWAPIMETLAVFRVSVAGAALGLARRALDICALHAGERIQFGQPLARQGAVAEMLAKSWIELESVRLLTYAAAARARDNPGTSSLQTSSMAKVAATEAAGRIVDRAQQIMGRFGMVRDAEIDRLWHAARPLRIYEGATEVLRGTIARELVGRVRQDAT